MANRFTLTNGRVVLVLELRFSDAEVVIENADRPEDIEAALVKRAVEELGLEDKEDFILTTAVTAEHFEQSQPRMGDG